VFADPFLHQQDARDRINRHGTERAVHENLRRIEYDAAHGPPGLRQFSSHLRQVIWPRNFKLEKLKKYDGKENPKNWITLYEIVVRSAAGDKHVMTNYFRVVLDQAGHRWLLGMPEDSFDSWEELRQAFIDNFIATCEQPGNKYDLERIRDRKNEPLHDYIRRFSDMRLKIPKISHDEAILAFIKGLCFHEALRSKLLRKRPTTVAELLATAKNYADADDVEKLIREDARGADQPPRRDDSRGRFDNRNPRRGDNRDHREGWDRRRDNRDDFRGKRPRDNDHEVNTVKRSNGRRDYQEDYNKTLKGPCQLHPKSNHTMEECRVLKNIYTQRAAQGDSVKKNGKQDRHEDEDDDQDRDPRHQYVSPIVVVHSIFGGKVSIESKQERKLLKRACLNVDSTDGPITDPKFPPGRIERSPSTGRTSGPQSQS